MLERLQQRRRHDIRQNVKQRDAPARIAQGARGINKPGEFRGTTLEEIRNAMKAVLRNVDHSCPSCG